MILPGKRLWVNTAVRRALRNPYFTADESDWPRTTSEQGDRPLRAISCSGGKEAVLQTGNAFDGDLLDHGRTWDGHT